MKLVRPAGLEPTTSSLPAMLRIALQAGFGGLVRLKGQTAFQVRSTVASLELFLSSSGLG